MIQQSFAVVYECPACKGPRRAPSSIVGEKRKCPHCGELTVIPPDAQSAPITQPFRYPPHGVDSGTQESGETVFVVRYVLYFSYLVGEEWDIDKLNRAIKSTPGAVAGEAVVDYGIESDQYYKCEMEPTAANVAALEKTGFAWTEAARELAGRVGELNSLRSQ